MRSTGDGVSVATDPMGRVLGASNSFASASQGFPGMLTEVPARGVPTPYARIGDLVAWLCLAGLAGISVRALRRRRRGRDGSLE